MFHVTEIARKFKLPLADNIQYIVQPFSFTLIHFYDAQNLFSFSDEWDVQEVGIDAMRREPDDREA